MQRTFFFVFAQRVEVTAESIPPDIPITNPLVPAFST